MAVKTTPRQLAAALPDNIRFLASLIARKPESFTPRWAATVDEAFSFYTRTSTVNLVLSFSNMFAAEGWPFPAHLDLRRELDLFVKGWPPERPSLARKWKRLIRRFGAKVMLALLKGVVPEEQGDSGLSSVMVGFFARDSKEIFEFWRSCPILSSKLPIIRGVEQTYRNRYWAACLPTALPILDFVIRTYFETNTLKVTIDTLHQAFEKAHILPKDLKPGYAVWQGRKQPDEGNAFADSLDQDLRLPGVLLASFVQFAADYYGWYKLDVGNPSVLNRHAILHCASEYWNSEYTTKFLMFLDLTLRLRRPLEVIIHGANAPWLRSQD
jgi:hypothetical protein